MFNQKHAAKRVKSNQTKLNLLLDVELHGLSFAQLHKIIHVNITNASSLIELGYKHTRFVSIFIDFC